jgi:hypothetical protein
MRYSKLRPLPVFLLNLLLVAGSGILLWVYPSNNAGFYLLLLTGCLLPFNGHKALSPYFSRSLRAQEPAGALVFQKGRSDFALAAVVCLGFAGAAYGIASGAVSPHRMGNIGAMLSVVFLCLVALAPILMLILGPLKVTLSSDGVQCKLLSAGIIPWHAIRDVQVGHYVKDYVALNLYEPEIYMRLRAPRYQRAARADQRRGLPLFILMPWMFGTEIAELKAALEDHIRRYGKKLAHVDSGNTMILKETE